jgi:hypothetical protein
MTKIRLFTTFILTLGVLLFYVQPARAVPGLPYYVKGTIRLNGNPVPEGTIITGWVSTYQCGTTTSSATSTYSLVVYAKDTATPGLEHCGLDGNTVTFHIGLLLASEVGTFVNGNVPAETINLTADPTSVDLKSFTAKVEKKSVRGENKSIILSWETTSEVDNLGFNLYRATSVNGTKTRINAELIPTLVNPGNPSGAIYNYTDMSLKNKMTYYYWLEEISISGAKKLTNPLSVKVVAGK